MLETLTLEDAFVSVSDAIDEIDTVTSYADLAELEDCLAKFWAGTLDEVYDLSRLYLPLEQLIPGRPLESQLDSDTMRKALYRLPEPYSSAIAQHFEPDCPELGQLMAHYFAHSTLTDSFERYLQETYYEALLRLAEIVRTLL
ncbi:hypothetical protein IQ268_09015 [Oculatella sp. LEGE 06141]|uniref:hypothetical protein n=1 Tax=Oculatella sp. LEGE 06141 TaxID=1828648 RepID=UPI00188232AC|nr:hypothetical protein [Oculatella sp. LEGE 06141]MBE9178699.1 hypothetical protein [Oculatella sp. LEGE 06141]